MIQNVLRRKVFQHLTRSTRYFSNPNPSPSPKTTIKLNSLPINSTFSSISESLKDLEFRKVELEPGCVLHFSNEADAEFCKMKVDNFNNQSTLTSRISSTTIPSLLLKNLPSSFVPDELLKHLSAMDPKYAQYFSGNEIQIVVKNAQDAIELSKLLKSTKMIQNNFGIQNVDIRKVKLLNDTYVITIPILASSSSSTVVTASKSIEEMKELLISLLPKDLIQSVSMINKEESVIVRIANDLRNETTFYENLTKILAKHQIEPNAIASIPRPVLILRDFGDFNDDVLNHLIQSVKPAKVQYTSRSSDVNGNIFLHFNSEKLALNALDVLRMETSKGGPQNKKFHVSFKEISEPAIRISNMKAAHLSPSILKSIVNSFSHHTKLTFIDTHDGDDDIDVVLITLVSPSEVKLIVQALSNRYEDKGLLVESVSNDDIGITLPSISDEKLTSLLTDLTASRIGIKSSVASTHRSLSVGFLTIQQVRDAKRYFYENASSQLSLNNDSNSSSNSNANSSSVVVADISFMTAFALEISGLSVDMSVKQLIDSLALHDKDGDDDIAALGILKTDRCALVKVKRHQQIVPALKKLKALVIDGIKLQPVRYRPLSGLDTVNATEYDHFENPQDEAFDTFALRKLLKDNLHADPATRYQIAQNLFERQLSEAKGPRDKNRSDIDFLLDTSFTTQARSEAEYLLNTLTLDEEGRIVSNGATQRLFQLYLQRQDMSTFLQDFKEFQAALGEENHEDTYNWAQFRAVTNKEMDAYDILQKDEISSINSNLNPNKNKKLKKISSSSSSSSLLTSGAVVGGTSFPKLTSDDDGDDDYENIDVPNSFERQKKVHTNMINEQDDDDDEDNDEDDDEEEDDENRRQPKNIFLKSESQGEFDEKISLEDIDMLTDRDGRVWSGIILNTDTVQKPMPGNRVVSHRALVVVGNLKGSCGMGVGKSNNVADAIKAAFRDALRNLIHIDLYDNFGLAHNLYGKHNSCHAYIRATPRNRVMVASPFAASILHRFGISTASVKVAGRRNPYAMCRAIFNAIAKHENLDESAKSRGLRYLTIRAAFQSGV